MAGKVKTSSREESVSAEIEMDLMVDNEPDVNINITEGNNLPFVSLINKAILNHIKSSIAQFITDLAAKAEGQKNKVEVRDTNALVHKDRERGEKGERERERERERCTSYHQKNALLYAEEARERARKRCTTFLCMFCLIDCTLMTVSSIFSHISRRLLLLPLLQ